MNADDLRERTDEVKVPKGAGIAGFMHVIREILRLNIQEITIDARGTVVYRHVVKANGDDYQPIGIDFTHLLPGGVIRNGEVTEVDLPLHGTAATSIGFLFEVVRQDRLFPVAWASGADTIFWEWHEATTGITLSHTVYGLPFHSDRHLDDSHLFLCAAKSKDSALIDTVKSYMIHMALPTLNTTVDVL